MPRGDPPRVGATWRQVPDGHGPARVGRPRRGELWVLAGLVAVALGLRVYRLGAHDLCIDELHTLVTVGRPPGEVVREHLAAGHLPLYFLLVDGWTALAGSSQAALRLPSALLGTALVLPAWRLFRHLVPMRAALWATAVVAVHPLLVELSREARMYPLLALLVVVAAEGAAVSHRTGRVPWHFEWR